MEQVDVAVIGGGMAGASIGYELAADRSVAVLDMEGTLGYHTTGRSAAMFLESYGGLTIRALTTASRAFMEAVGVLTPLPMLHIALLGRGAVIDALYEAVCPLVPSVELLQPAEATRRQPLLRRERLDRALLEPGSMEIDVHALHQHYLRGLRARGGLVEVGERLESASRSGGSWTITAADGRTWRAGVLVDAAGAWADEVARRCDVAPVGLRALRRTAFMVDAPPAAGPPMIAEIDDAFYVKPDAGRLLCSPADETPQDPSDARPDEVEIARAIDVINDVTTLGIRSVRSAWAGLRNFVADRTPVVGYDDAVDGFFWFAAQGGYGIQTAPALARVGAALLRGDDVPDDAAALGVTAEALAPRRPLLESVTGWAG